MVRMLSLRAGSDGMLMPELVAADTSPEETLENIQFEWMSDRLVRLRVRSSIFTFST